jgi:hypothetical protein
MALKIKNNLPIPYEPLTIHNIPIKGATKFANIYGNYNGNDQTQANIH